MMTDDERQMLIDLHNAFMKSPAGSDDPPLIVEIHKVVKAWQRASWGGRVLFWLLPAAAGVGIAIEKFYDWFGRNG